MGLYDKPRHHRKAPEDERDGTHPMDRLLPERVLSEPPPIDTGRGGRGGRSGTQQ